MSRSGSRVNARLPGDLATKVDAVSKRTGRSVSELVQEGLTRLCDAELDDDASTYRILTDVGFIGSASGPTDLSTTYKTKLTRSLGRKT